jgi:gliding motility-associated-like protein
LTHSNQDTRFELKYEREKPVNVVWNFEHINPQSVAFGASRTWNTYGVYSNEAVVSYADGCVIHHPLPTRVLVETSYIPNAFTPNGDGLNDTFLPKNSDVILIRTQIYDREGHLVSEVEAADRGGWDGNFLDGSPAPQGVYIYRMELRWLTDQSGGVSDVKQGTITLIR